MADQAPSAGRAVPSVGRIVHYVQQDGRHEAAIIVKVWAESDQVRPQTACNLTAFGDHTTSSQAVLETYTSVQQGEGPNSWHWPEYVAPVEPAS